MKLVIVSCLLAVALAKPQNFGSPNHYYNNQQGYYNPQSNYIQRPFVPILSQTQEVNPDGSYQFSFTTGDGKQAQESGYVKNAGVKNLEAEVVQGSYSYTAPDGTPISVRYIADENGFRAEGAHLPTPPPIPKEIQRSLELIAQSQRYNNQQPNYQQPNYQQNNYQQHQQPNYPNNYNNYQQNYNQQYNKPYNRNY